MTFIRFDIQVTEEEGVKIAEALKPHLPGFGAAYARLMNTGPEKPGDSLSILCRSRAVQEEMERLVVTVQPVPANC